MHLKSDDPTSSGWDDTFGHSDIINVTAAEPLIYIQQVCEGEMHIRTETKPGG